jgi:hypothetical protein
MITIEVDEERKVHLIGPYYANVGDPFFFFLSCTTLCEFWLAQLFLFMVSFPVPVHKCH